MRRQPNSPRVSGEDVALEGAQGRESGSSKAWDLHSGVLGVAEAGVDIATPSEVRGKSTRPLSLSRRKAKIDSTRLADKHAQKRRSFPPGGETRGGVMGRGEGKCRTKCRA